MTSSRHHPRSKALAHGRPPQHRSVVSLSSKATRTIIRTHHTLQKQRSKALTEGKIDAAGEISRKIEAQGGIESYQRASLLGQGNDRGGDSSKIFMDWLKPLVSLLKEKKGSHQLRMLEVGALSSTNACSRSRLFNIERIDLKSQGEGITQQDFMHRPLPTDESAQFDILSLSLVLNFVPDATARGLMLKRTLKFLRPGPTGDLCGWFPSLFLVLPVACITNSRYLDENSFEAIMSSLGYEKLHQKFSNKLAYYLWKATDPGSKKSTGIFKKTEVRAGKSRNNFAIVMK